MTAFHNLTTAVGSFPHLDATELSSLLIQTLDIPTWPQLPRRDFRESIYVQYGSKLPGANVNVDREKIIFNTKTDLHTSLEAFYQNYLDDNLDAFSLDPEFALGFYQFLEVLAATQGDWAKGQVIGPISFGLTVTDQDMRAILYEDALADALVKHMAMNARWQIKQLKQYRSNVILFVDEPYMASYGSAYINLNRDDAIQMMNEVFYAIQAEGAISGVHCCANTDWSVLLETSVNILNLDAYDFMHNLSLYPRELRTFLDREGIIAWGIVPNNESAWDENGESLAQRLMKGWQQIGVRAEKHGIDISAEELKSRSIIAPACGLGNASIPLSEHVLDLLVETQSSIMGLETWR